MKTRIEIDRGKVADFCRYWKITEFSLFGSVLRDDFGPGSDVDVLVTFAPDADLSLWDHVRMEEDLSALLGRPTEIIERSVIERSENWIRRKAILSSAEAYYVQG